MTALALTARCIAGLAGASIEGFFFDGHWLQFAAGILVYYRVNYMSRRQAQALHVVSALLLLAAVRYRSLLPSEVDRSTVAACCFALFISLIHPVDEAMMASRLLAPLRFCGRICYSMYLIHWPICKIISRGFYEAGVDGPWQTMLIVMPLSVLASVSASALFYGLVERQFLNAPAVSQKPNAVSLQRQMALDGVGNPS